MRNLKYILEPSIDIVKTYLYKKRYGKPEIQN